MNNVTFLRKKAGTPNRVIDFPRERDTFRNTIMEIVKDFDEKSYNNNGKPWKSSRILRVNPFFSFFFLFSSFFFIFPFFHFFHFFMFFIFFIYHFLFFHFFSFFHFSFFLFFQFCHFFHFFPFFIFHFFSFFFHFLSIFSFFSIFLFFQFFIFRPFSSIFFHFLSFSFIFFSFVVCSKSDFFGPQFRYDFSRQFLCEKSILVPISGCGVGLGDFYHVVCDVHRRLSDFLHAIVVQRRDEGIRGWRNWVREDPLVHPYKWLRPDPCSCRLVVLECFLILPGLMRNSERLGFPIFVALGKGRPALRNSMWRLRGGYLCRLRFMCLV